MLSLKRKTWRSTILNRSYAQNKEWSVVSRKWTGDQHKAKEWSVLTHTRKKKVHLCSVNLQDMERSVALCVCCACVTTN